MFSIYNHVKWSNIPFQWHSTCNFQTVNKWPTLRNNGTANSFGNVQHLLTYTFGFLANMEKGGELLPIFRCREETQQHWKFTSRIISPLDRVGASKTCHQYAKIQNLQLPKNQSSLLYTLPQKIMYESIASITKLWSHMFYTTKTASSKQLYIATKTMHIYMKLQSKEETNLFPY